jgi:hypothetical protein
MVERRAEMVWLLLAHRTLRQSVSGTPKRSRAQSCIQGTESQTNRRRRARNAALSHTLNVMVGRGPSVHDAIARFVGRGVGKAHASGRDEFAQQAIERAQQRGITAQFEGPVLLYQPDA